MALTAKLDLRQSQSLVMTPQLQQAIKLLQLSNLELGQFVESELERNPLLEREEREERPEQDRAEAGDSDKLDGASDSASSETDADEAWLDLDGATAAGEANGAIDNGLDNLYPDADVGDGAAMPGSTPGEAGWTALRTNKGGGDGQDVNLEAFVADNPSLADHLTDQLHLAISDPRQRLIAHHLIDLVDDAGYLTEDLETVADRLGAPLDLVTSTLAILQTFDPPGVFARSLAECLALQLKDRGRLDPVMQAFLDNLDLLAKHDFARLKRACGADAEDISDMIQEIKALNPKPGLQFGVATVQTLIPDVIVLQRADGSWHVELNSDTLPRVLVDRTYYTRVSKTASSEKDKSYLLDCLNTANWLVRSLDQRARTILKVAEEIVRQQDAFLTHGVEFLRPLNLKTVADAISMHESTVSRVTSNKYMATSRGIFELKYFFTSAIASSGEGEAHSSEAVRHRIKSLIDEETAEAILSDDRIVDLLRNDGIDIARRTVAKYREALRIPSSVQRRRQKKMQQAATL